MAALPRRSAETMSQILLGSPEQLQRLKTDPVEAVRSATEAAVTTTPMRFAMDPWLYRLVIAFLGSITLLVACGTIILAYYKPDPNAIPDGLVALGSAAVGALAGLLAPSPSDR